MSASIRRRDDGQMHRGGPQRPRSISVSSDKALMTVPWALGSVNAGSPFERRRELRPSVACTGLQTPTTTKPALASTNRHRGKLGRRFAIRCSLHEADHPANIVHV